MRVFTDCREQPSVSGCTLRISGEPEEVVRAAAEHAVSVHEHDDTPELRRMIRESLRPDATDPEVERVAAQPTM